jgi:hypothetical protein
MKLALFVVLVGCGGHHVEASLTVGTGGSAATDLDFSTVDVGQLGTATLTVNNDGTAPTGPLALAISGDAANDFAIDNAMTTCAGARLEAGGTCAIRLRFSPTGEGAREATLAISADPGGDATVALHGTGRQPTLALDPTMVDFGVVQAGAPVDSTIHVTNNGTTPAALSISTTGDVSRGITTCVPMLDVGATCDVAVSLAVGDLANHSGQLVVTSAGVTYVATLTAQGATSLTVNRTGSGSGTVTSSPAGIDCGTQCSAMFHGDVVLTATPAAGSAFTGWSEGSCGTAPTCTVSLGVSPDTVTASFALTGTSSIDITFAGGATGEIQISAGSAQATCFSSCSVPAQPGDQIIISAATPSDFTGWGGACSGTPNLNYCTIASAPAGSTAVTATFDHAAKQLWTRLPFSGERVVGAAFDGSDDLVAVTFVHVIKLDPSGGTMWMRSMAASGVATAADGSIYVVTSSALVKLDAGGTTLWSAPLDANSTGCGPDYVGVHCVAVGADDGIVVHGANGVAKYASDGTMVWSVPVANSYNVSVAVESTGVVVVGVMSEIGSDGMDALLLAAADGSVVTRFDDANVVYHGTFAVDAADHILGSSSGFSSVCLRETLATGAFGFTNCIDVPVASFVENSLAIAGTGDIAWLHYDDDVEMPTQFTLQRLNATATETWSLHRHETFEDLGIPVGTTALEVVASPSGRIALVGEYTGFSYDGAWIQVFSP